MADKGFIGEFKEFIMRGNVMDMAVGVVIGGAFGTIVSSLVEDIITPIIGAVTGGVDFSSLVIKLNGDAAIGIGNFINAILNFLIIALCIFSVIKAFNKAKEMKEGPAVEEEAAPATKICPYCKSEVAIDATRCPHCTSENI